MWIRPTASLPAASSVWFGLLERGIAACLHEELTAFLRYVEAFEWSRILEPFFSSDDYAIGSEKNSAAVS
jgi:hypothetical protein